MTHVAHRKPLTVQQQINMCQEIVRECRRNNDRLAEIVAALAEIVAQRLTDEYAQFD